MQKVRIDIRDHKARNKFCDKQNKLYGCENAYMCNISCPLYGWYETLRLMDMKNLSLGEAFRLSTRKSPTAEERRKIFRDTVEKGGKEYPAKSNA
jgi:hypothetical protein